jgi:hypothetical protein
MKGQPFAGMRLAKCCVFSHTNTDLRISAEELRSETMDCTLPLFGNSNLPANCCHDAGTDRVCGCKGRSWSVTGVLARGIREVATVATPAHLYAGWE